MSIPTGVLERHDELVGALRTHLDDIEEGRMTDDAEARAAYDVINADLTESETRMAEFRRLDDAEQAGLEAREASERLAENSGGGAAGSGDTGAVTQREQLNQLLRGEVRAIELLPETRDLTAGTATDGAELVPTSMHDQIIEHLVETSPVLNSGVQVVRTASGEQLDVPRTTSYSTAAIVAEAVGASESDPQFTTVSLGAYKYAFLVQVSSELLTDSAFSVEAFLARQGGAALGRGLGAHLSSGTGSSQPTGIDTVTTGVTAASATAITADELISLEHSVISPYRSMGVWYMNDSTLAAIRKLKDGNSQYLWQPGLHNSEPATLLGRPVFTDTNFSAIATGNTTIVFGDPSGYMARLAGPIRIEASAGYAFNADLVTWRFILRGDGDIVDTNALRKLVQL